MEGEITLTLWVLGNFDKINNPLSSAIVDDPGERERQRKGGRDGGAAVCMGGKQDG